MASRKKTEKNNPLVALAHRNKLSKQDIYKALHITASTYQSYIMNPYIMPLHRLIPLSGMLGLNPLELLYLLIRNKPILHKEHKAYIGSLIDKHK